MPTNVAQVLMEELQSRVGARAPVSVQPDPNNRQWTIRIGDNFLTTFREGEPFTAEIADRWVQEYEANRLGRGGWTAFAPPHEIEMTFIPHGAPPGRYTVRYDTATGVTQRIEGVEMPVTVSETIGGTANVASSQVRTSEQEARFRELDARARREAFDDTTAREYHALYVMAPATAVPAPPQRRIIVRVYRDDNGYWQIEVKVGGRNRDLPKVAVIKDLLPPNEKHFVPNRQGRYRTSLRLLETALNAGLSAQSLHDAIKAWALAAESALTHVESDSPVADNSQIELLRAQPATLEVGGKVYKLVPCGEIDVRPLITRVRTRAITIARVEGEAIKSRATTDARLVVSQAEQSAQAIRRAIEVERARLGNPVPEWVKISSREHKWDGSNWNVQLMISCKVDKVRLMVPAWEMILWWNALQPKNNDWYIMHKMPVWLRLHPEGVYALNDVSMKGEWETTHIASYCCMELQGLPTAITTNDLAIRLENGLSRGMRIINLNSPLGTRTFKYWPDFLAQIPTVPLRFLETGRNSEHYISPGRVGIEAWRANNPSITWDSEESTRSEADGVFTVREDTNATRA